MVYKKHDIVAVVTNSFNDATSVLYFTALYGYAGHSGIDFDSGEDAPVVAMYGGVVIEVKPDWPLEPNATSAGNYVKIQSYTNPDNDSGFVHAYLQLNAVDVAQDDHVKKGQQIGLSELYLPPACSSGAFSQWRKHWRSKPHRGKQCHTTQS